MKINNEIREILNDLNSVLIKILLISIILNIISLAPVLYMKNIYGPVVNSSSNFTLLMVTAMLLLMIIVSGGLEIIRFKMLSLIGLNVSERLSQRLYQSSFELYLKKRDSNARRIIQDFKILRTFISSPLSGALFDTPVSLLFLLLVMYVHPKMGMMSIFAAVIIVIVTLKNENKNKPIIAESNSNNVQSQLYVADSISNAQTIQAMGMLNDLRKRWNIKYQNYSKNLVESTENQITTSTITKFVMLIQGSAVIGVGCLLTLEGSLPPDGGSMIIASILGGKALQPLMRLIGGWKNLITAKESFENINQFLENNQKNVEKMNLPKPEGKLEIENLIARPPGTKKPVINGLTFTLKQGRSLAIIGPSGSGKSSLTKLIVGVWQPLSGCVRLDDADIYNWPKKEVGKYIGYLPQDIELMEGTILENICRFGIEDQNKAEKAASLVGIHDYIVTLKEGYLTNINEDDGIFSGGQIQKIGLARAIYDDPKLVVLDEPNSNLDKKGEASLYQTLAYLKSILTTVVVVTHRPELLNHIDRIIVLSEGRPKLYGPRDQVLEKLAGKSVESISPEEAEKYKKPLK